MPVFKHLLYFINKEGEYKASGAFKARVEIKGADNSFHAVGENCLLGTAAGILLAFSNKYEVIHLQIAGRSRQDSLR